MSTYQPPSGPQPEGTPAYAQPQDPWAGGFEQGLASVPTDPIPDPYGQGEVWSQATVAHGGQYGYVPPQQRSRAAMIVVISLAVLLLGGGGGYAAWYITKRNASANPGTSTPPATATATPTLTTPPAFDPHTVKVGDCLVNNGTDDDPDLKFAPCTTSKSFKVIKVSAGADIPEGPAGRFDRDVTSVAECKNTGYESWYGYQHPSDDSQDLFFCLTKNP